MLERDRQKVPFPSFDWDRPKPLVEAILEGARRVWVIRIPTSSTCDFGRCCAQRPRAGAILAIQS